MKRKGLLFFSFFVLFCGLSLVFRYQLLVGTTKLFLGRTLPKTLVYQNIHAKEQKVYIEGLHFSDEKMEMTLNGVEFGLDFQKAFRNPAPIFSLYRHGFSHFSELLAVSKRYGLDLSVETGVLTLGNERYYFHFKQGEKNREIGTLFVSSDPGLMDHPFLTMKFYLRADQILSQLSIERASSASLLHLASFVLPQYFSGFSDASGHVQLQANGIFEESGALEELSVRFSLENFALHHPSNHLTMSMDALKGDLHFPEEAVKTALPLWKQLRCGLAIENGTISMGRDFSLSKLQGNIALDARENPTMVLTGELASQEKPLFLELQGKGAVHEDHSYWLEFGLALRDFAGTECSAFLSICRPEKEALAVQIEADHLLPQQVEMLKGYFGRSMPRLKEWQVLEGSFGGKLVALFEKGNLSHFEMENFTGENVSISSGKDPLYLANVKGEGHLFSDLNFEMELPASHFFGLMAPELKSAYAAFRSDDFVHINTTIQFGEKEVDTAASVDFLALEESLQFGFKSKKAFPSSLQEISEGWVRCERLSPSFYAPFVKLASEDLSLYGEVDLLATYDGKVIESALQVDHFLVKHPLLDLKAKSIGEKEKTVGRIKLRYHPETHDFEGTLPVTKGEIYDRQYGLYLTGVEGDLQFSLSKLKGHLSHADVSFDSLDLIKDLSFYFSSEDQFDFHEIRGELVLPSSSKYHVYAPTFNKGASDIQLFVDDKQLVHFKGDYKEGWLGKLTLPQIGQTIPLSFSWNPLNDTASLEISEKGFTLKGRKEKEKYILEELQWGKIYANGSFQGGDQGIKVRSIEMKTPEWSLLGLGNLHVRLPQEKEDFALFGQLDYQVETAFPVPLQLRGKEPLSWSFSSSQGLVLSGMGFSGEGCDVRIGHLQHAPNGKQIFDAVECVLSQNVTNKIFESGIFPSFLQDFQPCKELCAKAHLEREKGATKVQGTLSSSTKDFDIEIDWKEGKGTFSIGQEEKLQFSGHVGENGFQLDKVQGSLSGLHANLKGNRKGEIKGNLNIDFSLLDTLIGLPLNRFVHLWKAGEGYQLEGTFSPNKRLSDWGFKGKIKGQNFSCGGYRIRSLEAKVEMQPGQMTIENLDVSDEAGKIWIEEGALMKAGQTDQWIFSFPLVEIRGFQPSSLRTVSGPKCSPAPLMLKTATLHDVRGRVDDPSTITGHGVLRFINGPSKEERSSGATLPIQELAHMGLEGALLIPASGEMEYWIQNGRIYLRDIRRMISEKNRSEFLPPKNGGIGYLDFNGNLFIDLLVRQKVARSPSAPFPLKVRGKWEEPQVFLK